MVSMMGRATNTPTAVPAILVSTARRSQEPAAAPHLQLVRVGCWGSPARVPDCKHTTTQ